MYSVEVDSDISKVLVAGLAATAVLRLIRQYDVDPGRVKFLGLGTESSTDNSAGAIIVDSSGVYWYTGMDVMGCPVQSKEVSITVRPAPQPANPPETWKRSRHRTAFPPRHRRRRHRRRGPPIHPVPATTGP